MKYKTVDMGLFLAFALLLSYIETLIPFSIGIPGIKIGLSNLAVLLCMYVFSFGDALLLTIMKSVITGFMFGNMFMILYSLTGAVISCVIMYLFKRSGGFHLPVVSALGGVSHNMGQLLIAYFAVKTYGVLYYIPFLLISGAVMGLLNGSIATVLLPQIKKIIKKREHL